MIHIIGLSTGSGDCQPLTGLQERIRAEPPRLAHVLDVADTLIDVTQVRDLHSSGASRLLIHSHHDHRARPLAIEDAARHAWNRYQDTACELHTCEDFHQLRRR